MPHQHHGGFAALGETHDLRRAFTQLRNTAGGGIECVGVQRLHRIEHHQTGAAGIKLGQHRFDAGLGQYRQIHARQAQALGAQAHLGQ